MARSIRKMMVEVRQLSELSDRMEKARARAVVGNLSLNVRDLEKVIEKIPDTLDLNEVAVGGKTFAEVLTKVYRDIEDMLRAVRRVVKEQR